MYVILALLIAFVSPLVLLPVEKVLPYPFIIEEIVKLILVSLILLRKQNSKWIWVFLIGFLFTVSESAFYLSNFLLIGDLSLFPLRIVLTGALHSATAVVMYMFGKRNAIFLTAGFLLAVVAHYIFNFYVIRIFA